MEQFYKELIKELIKRKIDNIDDALKLRRELCRKYNPNIFPSIIQILSYATDKEFEKLKFLVSKPTRTISGVTPVAIMTNPSKCPHGKCIMCPGGVDSYFGDIPQSYTGKEPATMRGVRNFFDSYLQVFNRLEQYVLLNQNLEKVELIIMGGTFPARSIEYQDDFVMYAFKAMNDFSEMFFVDGKLNFKKFKEFFELPTTSLNDERTKQIQKKVLKLKGKGSLVKEQKRNEKAKVRCVGLTIETRPDYGGLVEGNQMLKLGCTRVELGIQSVSDRVLKKINRGHSVNDSVKSMQVLKDLGFKINAHMMIGLPGDKNNLMKVFKKDFRPDMLKIYPCMVMPGTELEEMYKKGKFKPMTTEKAVKIIAKFKTKVPEYVRIMRVQRDIPTKHSVAGIDRTNLRQMIHNYMLKKNMRCNCIRCNEIKSQIKDPELKVIEYNASKGKEFYIVYIIGKEVIGFCRLRFPSKSLRDEITKDSGIVRELHVYGQAIGVGQDGEVQHKGFGKKLMDKAEEISIKNKKKKLLVISGIGVKAYYYKLGYKEDGPYVSKTF
ncbi:MAG: tRNA uridine(34) 5-carboxymethylaminomethyl modification radical SAM/GNAT enzyme Elp3 [archaeon]